MKTTHTFLIHPPFINYFSGPQLGIASIAGHLSSKGFGSTLRDLNAEMAYHYIDSDKLFSIIDELELELKHLIQQKNKTFTDKKRILALHQIFKIGLPILQQYKKDNIFFLENEIIGDHEISMPLSTTMDILAQHIFKNDCETILNGDIFDNNEEEILNNNFPLFDEFINEHLISTISQTHPLLVCLSVMSKTQIVPSLLIAKAIKKSSGKTCVILGGSRITAIKHKSDIIKDKISNYIDAIAFFEGETTVGNIVDSLQNNDGKFDFNSTGNILNFSKEKTIEKKVVHVENIESLPPPNFDDNYLNTYKRKRESIPIPIITSKSCEYGKCSYCSYSFQELEIRRLSIDKTIQTISELYKSIGARTFSFKDSLMNAKRAEAIAKRLLSQNIDIRWGFQTKLSKHFTKELVSLLYDAGCRTIEIGIETPNKRLQKLINKETSLRDIETVLSNFESSKINIIVNMIYGFPSETLEEANKSFRWASSLSNQHPNLRLSTVNHMLNVATNTTFSKQPKKHGINLIAESLFSAKIEWQTPNWHIEFGKKVSNYFITYPKNNWFERCEFINNYKRNVDNYTVDKLCHSIEEGVKIIEKIRVKKRILKSQAERIVERKSNNN